MILELVYASLGIKDFNKLYAYEISEIEETYKHNWITKLKGLQMFYFQISDRISLILCFLVFNNI